MKNFGIGFLVGSVITFIGTGIAALLYDAYEQGVFEKKDNDGCNDDSEAFIFKMPVQG